VSPPKAPLSIQSDKIGEFLKDLEGVIKIKVLQYHSFASSKFEALNIKNTMPNTVTTSDDVEAAEKK
jgi:pyruvate-formate lyase-activating enzyme